MDLEKQVQGYAWFYLEVASTTCVVYQLQGLPGIQSFLIESDPIFPAAERGEIMAKLSVRFWAMLKDVSVLKEVLSEMRGYRHAHFEC